MTPLVCFFFKAYSYLCVLCFWRIPYACLPACGKQNSRCSNLLGLTVFPVCFSLLLLFFFIRSCWLCWWSSCCCSKPEWLMTNWIRDPESCRIKRWFLYCNFCFSQIPFGFKEDWLDFGLHYMHTVLWRCLLHILFLFFLLYCIVKGDENILSIFKWSVRPGLTCLSSTYSLGENLLWQKLHVDFLSESSTDCLLNETWQDMHEVCPNYCRPLSIQVSVPSEQGGHVLSISQLDASSIMGKIGGGLLMKSFRKLFFFFLPTVVRKENDLLGGVEHNLLQDHSGIWSSVHLMIWIWWPRTRWLSLAGACRMTCVLIV